MTCPALPQGPTRVPTPPTAAAAGLPAPRSDSRLRTRPSTTPGTNGQALDCGWRAATDCRGSVAEAQAAEEPRRSEVGAGRRCYVVSLCAPRTPAPSRHRGRPVVFPAYDGAAPPPRPSRTLIVGVREGLHASCSADWRASRSSSRRAVFRDRGASLDSPPLGSRKAPAHNARSRIQSRPSPEPCCSQPVPERSVSLSSYADPGPVLRTRAVVVVCFIRDRRGHARSSTFSFLDCPITPSCRVTKPALDSAVFRTCTTRFAKRACSRPGSRGRMCVPSGSEHRTVTTGLKKYLFPTALVSSRRSLRT